MSYQTMTKRQPTPTGWSDTDWIKKLQDEEENPLGCLHINQGSFDAAADAYEEEYKMSKRTAMDIALDLDAAACSSFVKLEAAEALRQQQAEVERLTKQNAAYRTLNSAQSKQLEFHRSKDAEYQEAIATIDSERAANEMLTAERDAAIANASALTQHLTQVIGDHNAPSDCFSSGPMFGDPRDAICPACAALHFLSNPRASVDSGRDAAISAAVAAEREACAAVCDDLEATFPGTKTGNTLQWAAEKIRARSAK